MVERLGSKMFFLVVLICFLFPFYVNASDETCFKCHKKAAFFSAKVVHPPVRSERCDRCHSPHVARYKGLLRMRPVKLCFSCHEKEKKGFSEGLVHMPVEQGLCLKCHAPHKSSSSRLLRASVSKTCSQCHEKLFEKKRYAHAPFKRGQCLRCHMPHNSKRPNLLVDDPKKLCVKCHNKRCPKLSSVKAFINVERGQVDCLSCHTPHASNQAALLREFIHDPVKKDCSTCHSGSGPSPDKCFKCHKEVRDQMNMTHSHFSSRVGISCTRCHSPHAGDDKNLLRGSEYQVCRNCHGGTYERYKMSRYKHPDIKICSGCHEPHGSKHLAMLKGNGTTMCVRCHESQGKFTHPIGEDVLDRRTGQEVTCVTCHNPMGTEFKFELVREGKKDLCIVCHRAY